MAKNCFWADDRENSHPRSNDANQKVGTLWTSACFQSGFASDFEMAGCSRERAVFRVVQFSEVRREKGAYSKKSAATSNEASAPASLKTMANAL
jgi:hypothetical protein